MAYDRVQNDPKGRFFTFVVEDIKADNRPELCCGFNKSDELLAGGSIIRK